MVIFHSYVKLPEGNMTFQGWNLFTILYRLFFVNLNLQSTIQTQLNDSRSKKSFSVEDMRNPGCATSRAWKKNRVFFAQLPIGRQNHSSTMNIHHSSTMIPVRENSEVVMKFTQTNGYTYIYNYGLKPPFPSHSSTMNIQASPPFLRKTLQCHGSLLLPYWPRFPVGELFHHLPSTWRINQLKTIDLNLDNNWLTLTYGNIDSDMLFDVNGVKYVCVTLRGGHQRVANAAEDHVLLLGEIWDHLGCWSGAVPLGYEYTLW